MRSDAITSYFVNMSFIAYQIKIIGGAKDHGKNYIKVRRPLVRNLLRNRLLMPFLDHVLDSYRLDIVESSECMELEF